MCSDADRYGEILHLGVLENDSNGIDRHVNTARCEAYPVDVHETQMRPGRRCSGHLHRFYVPPRCALPPFDEDIGGISPEEREGHVLETEKAIPFKEDIFPVGIEEDGPVPWVEPPVKSPRHEPGVLTPGEPGVAGRKRSSGLALRENIIEGNDALVVSAMYACGHARLSTGYFRGVEGGCGSPQQDDVHCETMGMRLLSTTVQGASHSFREHLVGEYKPSYYECHGRGAFGVSGTCVHSIP